MHKLRRLTSKAEKIIGRQLTKVASIVRLGTATKLSVYFYGKWGMAFVGKPNYLSSRINFDGTNYGLIEVHEGVTISSFVRVLIHDWSLYTVAKAIGDFAEKPIGKIKGVSIGSHSFVGTGSIIMPGTRIGRGCIIGSGTVVRGTVPDYSIVIGSPGEIIGDSRNFIAAQFDLLGIPATSDL